MPAGRPSIYSEAVTATICERLADGESLRTICSDEKLPAIRTVMKWLASGEHPEFVQQYAHARDVQADRFAEEILEIADYGVNDKVKGEDGKVIIDHDVIARSRLRVDARKWLASKMAPKKYGDRIEHEHKGGINISITPDDAGVL